METSYSDRRLWCLYILFIIIIGGIILLFMCITRLASDKIFSPSNKIYRKVGRAKDVSAPWYMYFFNTLIIWLQGVHDASKNFISMAYVILFCLLFFFKFHELNVIHFRHCVCFTLCVYFSLWRLISQNWSAVVNYTLFVCL